MAIRKIKGSWWVDLRVGGKRRRLKSPYDSRAAARDYEALLRREITLHGTIEGLRKATRIEKPLTFAAFAEAWLRDYVAVNNKRSEQYTKKLVLERHLLPAFGKLPLAELKAQQVEQLKARLLATGLKAKSINNYLTILARCLQTAVEWGHLAAAPRIAKLKAMRPSRRFLAEDELQRLVAAGDGLWGDLVLTVARTGLRRSEFIALDWQDLDFRTGQLTVQRAWVNGQLGTPKDHEVRHLPLTSDVLARLGRRRASSGPVFTLDGAHLHPHRLARGLNALARRAGLEPLGWHVLRHTYASHLAQAGVPLLVVKELLGHSSMEMVLLYAHLAPQSHAVAIEALERRGRESGHQRGTSLELGERIMVPSSPAEHAFMAQPTQKGHVAA